MHKISEGLRARVGMPTDGRHLPRLPEQFSEPVRQLLTEGASLEKAWLQRIDRAADIGGIDGETSEEEACYNRWRVAVRALITRVDGSELDDQTQRLIARAFADIGGRLRQTQDFDGGADCYTSAGALGERHVGSGSGE